MERSSQSSRLREAVLEALVDKIKNPETVTPGWIQAALRYLEIEKDIDPMDLTPGHEAELEKILSKASYKA